MKIDHDGFIDVVKRMQKVDGSRSTSLSVRGMLWWLLKFILLSFCGIVVCSVSIVACVGAWVGNPYVMALMCIPLIIMFVGAHFVWAHK